MGYKDDLPKVNWEEILKTVSNQNSPLEEMKSTLHNLNKPMEPILDGIYERKQRQEQREIDNHRHLKETAENTAVLKDIVLLIRDSNENQEDIIGILVEILSISKATTQAEAKSRYDMVLARLANFNGSIDAITKLTFFAGTLLTIASGHCT